MYCCIRAGAYYVNRFPTKKANGAPVALSLLAMTSQYFIGGMMAESANPVQQPQTIIEIRPFKRRSFHSA